MKDKDLTCFSIKLKELREEKKLTQSQLAKILQTSKQSIWNYESSHREPNIEMIIDIAKYFNVSIDYLLGNNEYKNSTQKSLNELLSEKLEIPSESSNELAYLFNQYLEIIKLLFHPLLPHDTKYNGSYTDLKQLIQELENCIVWLHDYMIQSIEDINVQHRLIMATSEGNDDLVKLLENNPKNYRNNSFYFIRFNHSLNNCISSLQTEHKKLLENTI